MKKNNIKKTSLNVREKKLSIDNIKKFLIQKDISLYIYIFVLMLIICICVPYCGDDWGNYSKASILDAINAAIMGYNSHESRLVSRFLIVLLVYRKWIWCIINPLMVTLLTWSINKLFKIDIKNNKKLIVISLFVVSCSMFAQVLGWVVGSITYLFPAVLVIFYCTLLFRVIKNINIKNFWILFLLNLIIPFFVDNMAAVLIVVNIAYIVYKKIINKKIQVFSIILLIISIISLYFILAAPGNANRLTSFPDFEKLTFFGKIIYNIPNFINLTYYANLFMIFLMLIPMNYYVYNWLKSKIALRYLCLSLLNIFPMYAIISMSFQNNIFTELTQSLSYDFYFEGDSTLLTSNFAYAFWILFSILFIIVIFKLVKDKKLKLEFLLLLFIGITSNGSLLISPIWGYRTAFFTAIVITGLSIGLINIIMKENKYSGNDIKWMLNVILIIIFIFYSTTYVLIAKFDNMRLNDISEQVESGRSSIDVKMLPLKLMLNYNPYWDFHLNTYKTFLKNSKVTDRTDYIINLVPINGRRKILNYDKD